MEKYKFTQFGTAIFSVFLSLIIIFTVIAFITGTDNPAFIAFMIVSVVLFICLLVFYNLTIYIDRQTLSFRMGIGLIKKKYRLSDIASCKPVKNNPFYGIGVRLIPNGRLYNVSGLYAIELRFKHTGRVVRIGTNRPEEISRIVEEMIGGDTGSSPLSNKMQYSSAYHLFWIVPVIAVGFLLVIPQVKETKVEADSESITIKGFQGERMDYLNILEVDTVLHLPDIKTKTMGYALAGTIKGKFKTTDGEKVKLFVKSGYPPYILIRSKDRMPVYLNFRDRERTITIYKELKSRQ